MIFFIVLVTPFAIQETGGFGGQSAGFIGCSPSRDGFCILIPLLLLCAVTRIRSLSALLEILGCLSENKPELGPPPRLAYAGHTRNSIAPCASLVSNEREPQPPRASRSLPYLTFPPNDPNCNVIIFQDTQYPQQWHPGMQLLRFICRVGLS